MSKKKDNRSPSGRPRQGGRMLSCYVFTFLEICASRFTLFDRMLTRWRTPVFSQEIDLLQIAAEEKVLHIGCGAFPSASLFIAQGKHARVVGIDNNTLAVKLAQSYIRKKQLTSLITIEKGDGIRYPLAGFDVIFIAVNVWPIDAVLLHCACTMKPTARILVKGTGDDVTALLKEEEFGLAFSVTATIERPKMQSFVLTKKTK
jgi:precorrin-6B methylase 2